MMPCFVKFILLFYHIHSPEELFCCFCNRLPKMKRLKEQICKRRYKSLKVIPNAMNELFMVMPHEKGKRDCMYSIPHIENQIGKMPCKKGKQDYIFSILHIQNQLRVMLRKKGKHDCIYSIPHIHNQFGDMKDYMLFLHAFY